MNIIKKEKNTRKMMIFIYAIPCIINWIFYWFAFFPGIMTNDAFSQWGQAHSGRYGFTDAHPVPHTLLIKAISKVWDNPAAISLFQMLFFAFVMGYILYVFEKLGVNKKILFMVSILFSLNPVNACMSIGIWKDLIYNISIALVTLFIMNMVLSDGNWIDDRKNQTLIFIAFLIMMFFRHNGVLVFLVTMAVLLLMMKSKCKILFSVCISILVLFVLVKGPIYKILRVEPGSTNEAFAIPTQQIAAVVKYNGILTYEQKQYINTIMPLKTIVENYHPYSVDLLKFHDEFHKDVIVKDKKKFLYEWFHICAQNPKIVTQAFMNQTSLVWQIREPGGRGYTYTINREVVKNNWNIKNKVWNQRLTYMCNKIVDFTELKGVKWLFWRPALPLLGIMMFAVIAVRKNNKHALIILLPVLINNISILVAIPAQDYRYLHANNMVFVIVMFFSMLKYTDEKII